MKRKNWRLFVWAFKHLKLDHENSKAVYKECLRNSILLRLMDLSGVTPNDASKLLQEIKNELAKRGSP